MPSAARQRWLGKGNQLNMRKVGEQAHRRNGERSPRADATSVWSADFAINQRECLRAELRQHRTHAAIDVRRWLRSPDGDLRATERGLALALRHLPAMKALIDAAVVQAQADGLLDDTVKGGAS
jgi:hypothetical protein